MDLHHNLFSFLRAFNSLVVQEKDCRVVDDSMYPSYCKGAEVRVDQHKAAMSGDIVAIASARGIVLREVLVRKGTYYLIAHNHAYPKVALEDFRALDPQAYFLGVVSGSTKSTVQGYPFFCGKSII